MFRHTDVPGTTCCSSLAQLQQRETTTLLSDSSIDRKKLRAVRHAMTSTYAVGNTHRQPDGPPVRHQSSNKAQPPLYRFVEVLLLLYQARTATACCACRTSDHMHAETIRHRSYVWRDEFSVASSPMKSAGGVRCAGVSWPVRGKEAWWMAWWNVMSDSGWRGGVGPTQSPQQALSCRVEGEGADDNLPKCRKFPPVCTQGVGIFLVCASI